MKNTPIKSSTQDDYIKTSLRLPKDLHQKITALADYNGHGFNAEIIAQLRAQPALEMLTKLLKDNAEMKSMLRELLDAADRK